MDVNQISRVQYVDHELYNFQFPKNSPTLLGSDSELRTNAIHRHPVGNVLAKRLLQFSGFSYLVELLSAGGNLVAVLPVYI